MADTDSNVIKKHPHGIFLTSSNFGLEGFAAFIKDENLHKLASISIPIIVGILSFVFRRIVKSLESQRGIKTYNEIIVGLETEYNLNTTSTTRKQQTRKEITKYKNDIINAKKDNIKIFID